ncbi:MAG: hypothetical protein ACR2PL_09015 [Dehalococcoidia bacterium]
MRRGLFLLLVCLAGLVLNGRPAPVRAQTIYGYYGLATYYGIEDGVRPGDVMYDGTPYDPADPTITSAAVLFPLHTWLLVCTQTSCLPVQVRDRGYLDQAGVLVDLSRAAYYTLFGGLGGAQRVSVYFMDRLPAAPPVPSTPQLVPVQPPSVPAQPAPPLPASPPPASPLPTPSTPVATPPAPSPSPSPKPGKMSW